MEKKLVLHHWISFSCEKIRSIETRDFFDYLLGSITKRNFNPWWVLVGFSNEIEFHIPLHSVHGYYLIIAIIYIYIYIFVTL